MFISINTFFGNKIIILSVINAFRAMRCNMETKILIIGANGQLGSVLTTELIKKYGRENVIASDLAKPLDYDGYLFEVIDAKAPFSPFCMTVRVEPKTGAIWAGWGVFPGEHGVFRRQANGVWSEKMNWGGMPSQFRFTNKGILAVMIGSYFPSDEAKGELVKVVQNKPVRFDHHEIFLKLNALSD